MFRVQPVQLLSRLNRLDGRTSCPPDRGMQRAVPQLDDKNHFFLLNSKICYLYVFVDKFHKCIVCKKGH